MKRFSWIAFIIATLLHIYGTSLIYGAGMRMDRALLNGQPEQHVLLLETLTWIWLPIPMLLKPLFPMSFFSPPYFLYAVLSWSLVVGVCFGYVMPSIIRWRRHNT
ncbi:MAG: hypothetical protein QOI04_255 [Verrucomicrobiota bacterium]|jgi:Ca2+/H+ antiporter